MVFYFDFSAIIFALFWRLDLCYDPRVQCFSSTIQLPGFVDFKKLFWSVSKKFFISKAVGRLLGAPQVAKLPVSHAGLHSHPSPPHTRDHSHSPPHSYLLFLPSHLTFNPLSSQLVLNWLWAAGVAGVFVKKPLTRGAPSFHLRGR